MIKKILITLIIFATIFTAFSRPIDMFVRYKNPLWIYRTTISDFIFQSLATSNMTANATLSSITSSNGGAWYINWNGYTNTITGSVNPTNINGIIPWIVMNRGEAGFFTNNWGTMNGNQLLPYRNYSTSTNTITWVPTDNVRATNTIINVGINYATNNSLVLDNATPFTQCRTKFRLLSGALMINATIPYIAPFSTTTATAFDFADKRGYIWLKNDAKNSYISYTGDTTTFDGTNGVVVSGDGDGSLVMDGFGATAGLGKFYANQSGDFWVNSGGEIAFAGSNTNLLGTGNCTWYLQGGSLRVGGDGTIDYNRSIVFNFCTNSHLTTYTYFATSGNVIKKFRSLRVVCSKASFRGFAAVASVANNYIQFKEPFTLLTNTELECCRDELYTAGKGSNVVTVFLGNILGNYNLTLSGGQYFEFYGTNTYSGATTITNIQLNIFNDKSLTGTSRLNLMKGGKGGIVFLNTGITATNNSLYYANQQQLQGSFGSSSSAATYKDDTHFAGSGILIVTNGNIAPTNFDLVLGIGQSNMNGMGNLTNSPDTTLGAAYLNTGTSSMNTLRDPTYFLYGSCVPAFANAWYARTGRGVIYVAFPSINGASLIAAASPNFSNNWSKTEGTNYLAAVNKFNAAIANIPTNYPIASKVVIWAQGERDAGTINGSNVTGAIYQTNLVNLITNLNADITGGIASFRISELGALTNGTFITEFAAIRTAQSNAVTLIPYAKMPFTGAKDFVSQGKMVDVVHYSQEGLNEMGVGLASGEN